MEWTLNVQNLKVSLQGGFAYSWDPRKVGKWRQLVLHHLYICIPVFCHCISHSTDTARWSNSPLPRWDVLQSSENMEFHMTKSEKNWKLQVKLCVVACKLLLSGATYTLKAPLESHLLYLGRSLRSTETFCFIPGATLERLPKIMELDRKWWLELLLPTSYIALYPRRNLSFRPKQEGIDWSGSPLPTLLIIWTDECMVRIGDRGRR